MNGLFATRNVLFYCFVVMMMLRHTICMNGTFPDISINCKTYVVGYPCAIKCHVPDFKHEIVIFGPQNTRVGRCSSDRLCSVVHNGFELKRNLIMKSIILKISELNKNHVGNWYCVYGGGRTSNVVQLQKVKDLPTERTTSRYLEVNEGESITLHCDFDFCTDCYVIKWYKDGIELQGKDPSYQVEFQNLTITKITQEDKGVYMCSVTESGFTIRNGPYIVIYSVRKKPLDPQSLTENPSPTRSTCADTSQASFLILLQRWIVVLGRALILISTPTTITVVKDVSVFSSATVNFIVTVIICNALIRNKLIVSDSGNAEEQGSLPNRSNRKGSLRNRRNRTM